MYIGLFIIEVIYKCVYLFFIYFILYERFLSFRILLDGIRVIVFLLRFGEINEVRIWSYEKIEMFFFF